MPAADSLGGAGSQSWGGGQLPQESAASPRSPQRPHRGGLRPSSPRQSGRAGTQMPASAQSVGGGPGAGTGAPPPGLKGPWSLCVFPAFTNKRRGGRADPGLPVLPEGTPRPEKWQSCPRRLSRKQQSWLGARIPHRLQNPTPRAWCPSHTAWHPPLAISPHAHLDAQATLTSPASALEPLQATGGQEGFGQILRGHWTLPGPTPRAEEMPLPPSLSSLPVASAWLDTPQDTKHTPGSGLSPHPVSCLPGTRGLRLHTVGAQDWLTGWNNKGPRGLLRAGPGWMRPV